MSERGERLGAGREAEVFAWGDAVVKLYRTGYPGHRAEAAALSTLDSLTCAPRLFDVVDQDGRTGLVLERLDGSDMLTLLERQPWHLFGLARALATTQLSVHSVQAPAGLPDLRPVLGRRIGEVDLVPGLRGYARRVLDGLPDGDRLCHGDFHPGNLLVTPGDRGDRPRSPRVMVIDWPAATRGVPDADHARTLLLLRWANPLPETRPVARAVIAAGRSLFTRRYARSYASALGRPLCDVHAWLVVHAAARLSEDIDAERPHLVGLIEQASRTQAG